mgnify:CR=1 FL=1
MIQELATFGHNLDSQVHRDQELALTHKQKNRWYMLRLEMLREIQRFGASSNGYGEILFNHLKRTARETSGFMTYLGYTTQSADLVRNAMLMHDLGKVHPDVYSPQDWMTHNRPDKDLKKKRDQHPRLGREIFEERLQDKAPELGSHPYFSSVIPTIIQDHHNLAHDSHLMRAIAVIDTYDGDLNNVWPHQDGQRDAMTEFRRLLGIDGGRHKYAGKTDKELVMHYAEYKQQQGINIRPGQLRRKLDNVHRKESPS